MNRLRTRLLLSYVFVIVVMLAVIGATLVLVLGTRPLPVASAYQSLTDIVRGLAVRFDSDDLALNFQMMGGPERVLDLLARAAELRILVAEVQDGQPFLVFDSLGALPPGEIIPAYQTDLRRSHAATTYGAFTDLDGSEWLFVGMPRMMERMRMGRMGMGTTQLLLFAEPAPKPGLVALFEWFGDNLLAPILEAGLLGLAVAAALAVLIARSVAQPLLRMAQASEAVAAGDLDQQVPITGPDEVRRVAQAFNHMTQRVKANQQAQREFVANVSHDLRTPLTSIQGFSQAVLDGAASSPESIRRAATVIHDESARLTRMVEELLDLARIESGEWKLVQQVVNPALILRTVGERMALRAGEAGVTLKALTPDLPDIIGDGDRLAQMFTNLVDNALKHTPPGGTVTLDGRCVDAHVELVVADTGAGIPPEDLPRIFERFYQVDKSRQRDAVRPGVGLGLAICREIAEAHGGTIHAESAVDAGARFVVRLPLPRSEAD
mgnify:CR=1 FL=1